MTTQREGATATGPKVYFNIEISMELKQQITDLALQRQIERRPVLTRQNEIAAVVLAAFMSAVQQLEDFQPIHNEDVIGAKFGELFSPIYLALREPGAR